MKNSRLTAQDDENYIWLSLSLWRKEAYFPEFQYINHYYFCKKILTFRGNLDLRVAGLCLTCKYPRSLVVLVAAIWFCCCFCEPAIFCSSEAFNIPCVCGILRQWFSLTCKTNQYGINLLSRKTLHHAFSISVKLDGKKCQISFVQCYSYFSFLSCPDEQPWHNTESRASLGGERCPNAWLSRFPFYRRRREVVLRDEIVAVIAKKL